MAPKENTQVNLRQLMYAAYIFAFWYLRYISWSIDSCQNKLGVCWPVLHDRIAGSRVELAKFTCFFSLPLIRLWILIGSQAQVFSQIIKTSQKIEAPLLGLAKSIYYLLVGNGQSLFFSFSSKIFVFSLSVLYTVRLSKSKMVRFMENSFKSGAFSSVIHVYIYKVSHRIRFGLTEKFVKLQFRPLKLWCRLCSRFALGCAEEFWRFSVFCFYCVYFICSLLVNIIQRD